MSARGRIPGARAAPGLALALSLALAASAVPAPAAAAATADDFIYYTQPGDTLIGLGRRLLVVPANWHGLQSLNAVRQPHRMPTGTPLRIPRDWLKQDVEHATVVSASGAVSHDGGTVKAGDSLAQGAQLVTQGDGFLTFRLADGSLITLDPNSSLRLERLTHYPAVEQRDTRIQVQSGRVETQVRPQGRSGRFEIRTPVAVSAVRGTQFRRSVDANNVDRTEVTEGTVAVSGSGAGPAVELPRNFGTVSDADGPHPPVQLLPPPDLRAVTQRWDSPQATLDFPAVQGASGYTAQAATDEQFQHIVAETHSAQPPLNFGSLPDARYWVRVRSTDAQGLSGADATTSMQRQRRLEAPSPQISAGTDIQSGGSAALSWTPVAEASGYQVQWARDGDPSAATDAHEVKVENGQSLKMSLEPGRYGWRVAALDQGGKPGLWSAVHFFTQKADAPQLRRVLADRKQLRFEWQEQPGRQFRLQVARDANFEHIAAEQASADSHAELAALPAGVYHVRVQAVDADGYVSPWSEQRQFSVPPPWWVFAAPFLLVLPFL